MEGSDGDEMHPPGHIHLHAERTGVALQPPSLGRGPHRVPQLGLS